MGFFHSLSYDAFSASNSPSEVFQLSAELSLGECIIASILFGKIFQEPLIQVSFVLSRNEDCKQVDHHLAAHPPRTRPLDQWSSIQRKPVWSNLQCLVKTLDHSFWLFFKNIALDNDLCQFNSCLNKTMNSQAVIDFCTKQSGVIYARCCLINTTTTTMATTTASMNAPAVSGKSEQQYIIGLDLSNCQIDSLSKVLDTFERKLYQHIEILWVCLQLGRLPFRSLDEWPHDLCVFSDFSENQNVTECPDDAYRGFLKLDFL